MTVFEHIKFTFAKDHGGISMPPSFLLWSINFYPPILGHYAYIETSYPRVTGDKAWLVSDIFKVDPNFNWCLTFWVHMYGNSVGYLNVYKITDFLKPTADKSFTRLFRLTGNHGDNWVFQQLQINSGHDFQVSLFNMNDCG